MISTLIFFNGNYYEYHGREKEEQYLAIGGYEAAFLSDLVISYLFTKYNTLFRPDLYHGIYQYDRLLVFRCNNIPKEITYWLDSFQRKLNSTEGSHHL